MPVLDFREIASPTSPGHQDAFELFAREFLVHRGFEIVDGPDRGADAGRDLIAVERRRGVAGETSVRWLVSCKHKAHSGTSVGVGDEQNVRDRVEVHKCQGFIGFYSTVRSSGLTQLIQPTAVLEVLFWDQELIERELLQTTAGVALARRYFPRSVTAWERENPPPADLYGGLDGIACEQCGNDLLSPPSGIVVTLDRDVTESEVDYPHEVVDIYWCCKGDCDRALKSVRRTAELVDGWKDIPGMMNPQGFAQATMATINRLRGGERYSQAAFDKHKRLLLELFRYVAREPTRSERDRWEVLSTLPSILGGIGEN